MKSIRWFTLLALTVVAPRALHADRVVSTNTTQDGGTFVVDPVGTLTISDSSNDPSLTLTNGASTSGITKVIVGYQSGGEIRVEAGSTLTNSGDTWVGYHDGSNATVTITGASSQWQNVNYFNVGGVGTGFLNVQNAGILSSGNSSLGITQGSNGTATIAGNGSQWNTDSLVIGLGGTGTLNVMDGGIVTTRGSVDFGVFSGSNGTATIGGTGSEWRISNHISFGGGIKGVFAMNIENGGLVSSATGDLNKSTVTVTGAGSKWESISGLQIDSNGTLNVNDGGVVVGGRIELRGTVSGGNGTIIGSVDNWSGGLIAFGDSPGVLTIDGDLTNYGTLKFGIAGAASSLFNQLIVTGDLSLGGGGVEIDLLDGFTPTAHSEFKLIDASNFNRPEIVLPVTFDFTHAALGAGLSWDTSTFAVDGTIRVVPETSSLVLAGVGAMAGFIGWRTKSRSQ